MRLLDVFRRGRRPRRPVATRYSRDAQGGVPYSRFNRLHFVTSWILLSLYLVSANISTLMAHEIDSVINSAASPAALWETNSATPAAVSVDLPAPPSISADAAIVIDANTGFILYEREAHTRMYPASLVKIMTALIAIEQYGTRLYEPVYFSRDAVFSIPRGSSHIAMDEGESLTMEEALHGLLLASANEVAMAIAEHIAGDAETFVELMNRRAAAIGASNTNFANPTGLHSAEQYSTAYDMALIMNAAAEHPVFLEILSTTRYDIPPTERQPSARELLNDNRMLREGAYHDPRVVGGKTGFTNESRHTLASFAAYDGRELITITLRGERLFGDTADLLEYAFSIPYEPVQIFNRNEFDAVLPVYAVEGRDRKRIGEASLIASENLYVDLPRGFDAAQISSRLVAPGELRAPVLRGDRIGRKIFFMDDTRGRRLGEIELRAAENVTAEAPATSDNYDEEAIEAGLAGINLAQEESAETGTRQLLEDLAENYFLTFALPLGIFVAGLMAVVIILKVRYSRKEIRSGRYSVIGTSCRRQNP